MARSPDRAYGSRVILFGADLEAALEQFATIAEDLKR
jgi:hypothetical protein